MKHLTDWIAANPLLFTVVVWPLVSAIVTTILRKPTAEEYARMNPRVAALRRFIAAIGLDAPKALETIRLFLSGGVPGVPAAPTILPPPPPSGINGGKDSEDPPPN